MSAESPPNPLAQLCQQMGLPADFLARKLNLDPAHVAAALELNPPEPLATYVRLLHEIDTRLRVQPAEPISLWIGNRAMHRLIRDDRWRKEVGLCKFPKSTQDIVDVIKILRGRGMTLEQITTYMQMHFVPTGWGRLKWDEDMVRRRLNAEGPPHDREVRFARDGWRTEFRRYVVSQLLVRIFPPDPAAFLRYGFDVETGPEKTIVRGKERMPACVKEWALESLRAIRWFPSYEWGIETTPPWA